jgi:hypothetical protein
MEPMTVDGWHMVGAVEGAWKTCDFDGCYSGLPSVHGWEISGGETMRDGGLIPCWRSGGRWVTLDRQALERALRDAADSAKHGDEPEWWRVDDRDMHRVESRYIIRDAAVVEVEVLHGGIAECADGTYWAEAWTFDVSDDIYDSHDEAIEALKGTADNGEVYPDGAEAIRALGWMVADAHDLPPGLAVGHDKYGLFVIAEDGDNDEKYHLYTSQLTAVMRNGWAAVLNEIIEALGIRATLEAAQSWQSEMDRIAE